MGQKIVNTMPGFVKSQIDPIKGNLLGAGFDIVSVQVHKHYRYPCYQFQVYFKDPPLMPDGHGYELVFKLPDQKKPSKMKRKVDHSKLRSVALNVWHPEATQLEISALDIKNIDHKEWKMVYED